jgi:NTE family protein
MKTPRIGLALGSGSARGWAHIGILRALEERGIRPDVVAGASVGALVGSAYASGRLEVLEQWVRELTRRDVWRLVDGTLRGGVMRGDRVMEALAERIGDLDIGELPVTFGAVATDLDTSQEVWIREGSLLNAVRASSGMPGLFAPMWYQDRWLVDGGVVNPVPVSLCLAMGADYVIAVNLNSHLSKHSGLVKRFAPAADDDEGADEPLEEVAPEPPPTVEDGDAIPREESSLRSSLERFSSIVDGLVEAIKPNRSEGPGIFDVMATSINIMQDRITRSRMVGDPPAVMLSPKLGDFQIMDFHRADEAVEIGRETVRKASEELDALQASLAE